MNKLIIVLGFIVFSSIVLSSCFSSKPHHPLKEFNKDQGLDQAAATCAAKTTGILSCSLSKEITKTKDSKKTTYTCVCVANKAEDVYRYLDYQKRVDEIQTKDKTDD